MFVGVRVGELVAVRVGVRVGVAVGVEVGVSVGPAGLYSPSHPRPVIGSIAHDGPLPPTKVADETLPDDPQPETPAQSVLHCDEPV